MSRCEPMPVWAEELDPIRGETHEQLMQEWDTWRDEKAQLRWWLTTHLGRTGRE